MALEIRRIRKPKKDLVPILFKMAGDERPSITNQDFFDKEQNILLVAYEENQETGFLYAYLLESIQKKSPKMFLYSIDVFEEFQQRGIGTALIEQLKEIAKKHNCHEIFVFTNDSNEVAKKLYQKTGGKRENIDDLMYVYDLD